jgi:plastocyanin
MRRLFLLPIVVFALAAASSAGAAADHTIAITKAGFATASTNIPNGDSVTWKNTDTANHQVIADDGSFSSPILAPGESYKHIFPDRGTWAYHDGYAPTHKGSVTVREERFISLQPVRAEKVMFTHSLRLKGQVSAQNSNGEEVVVQARPYGETDFQTVARTTTSSGFWNVLLKPRRNTEYRAVWQNVPSEAKTIWVTPMLKFRRASGGRVAVAAYADVSLRGHRVLLQRLNRRHHVWRTVRSVRLTHFKANRTSYIASATVRLRVAHGTLVRAFMTRRQAGPAMFGPAWSRALRA